MPTTLPHRRRHVELVTPVPGDGIDGFFLILLPCMAILMTVYLATDPGKREIFLEASQAIVCADATLGYDCFDDPAGSKPMRMAHRLTRPHVAAHVHAISG